MNQKEIVDKLEEILACVSCSEYTYNYGEIIVGGFMEGIFGKELKPWQGSEKPETER